jgi:hypothetical protein
MNCKKFVKYEKETKKSFFGFGEDKIEILYGIENNKGKIYKFKSFNEFEKDEMEIPYGYKKVKMDKKLIKDYFCDNSRKLLEKDNENYKKIKDKHKNEKTYFIHDNYERPFLVYSF